MKKMIFGAMLFLGGLLGQIAMFSLSILVPWSYTTPNGNVVTGFFGFLLGTNTLLVFVFFITIFLIGFKRMRFESANENKTENKDTYFYFGQSYSWFATYSITKVKASYYDSLSMQYLFDDNSNDQTEKIGPIEYELIGNPMKIQSSYPQELQGFANFHTGSRMNISDIKITFDKDIELTVK
ncbi:MAG: hypothetical protein Q8858_16615, partial [Bacteroidota bacterium]|nr:hypothetical protein [Bacteroidota bacterium]